LKRSQVITFTELKVEKKIGTGSYGKVCLGQWNAAPVALKFCRKKGNLEDFMREIRLMIKLPSHPNVVQLFGVSLDGPQPIIVLEYCAGEGLDKLLFQTNVTLSDEHKIRLVRGIAAGMLHLHKNNIVHRDLAARNILLTASGDPKISVHYEISVVSIFIPNTSTLRLTITIERPMTKHITNSDLVEFLHVGLWHVSHFGKGRRRQGNALGLFFSLPA
jgi:serine/threonine protein kinase